MPDGWWRSFFRWLDWWKGERDSLKPNRWRWTTIRSMEQDDWQWQRKVDGISYTYTIFFNKKYINIRNTDTNYSDRWYMILYQSSSRQLQYVVNSFFRQCRKFLDYYTKDLFFYTDLGNSTEFSCRSGVGLMEHGWVGSGAARMCGECLFINFSEAVLACTMEWCKLFIMLGALDFLLS
jgi:hypothetical protein